MHGPLGRVRQPRARSACNGAMAGMLSRLTARSSRAMPPNRSTAARTGMSLAEVKRWQWISLPADLDLTRRDGRAEGTAPPP